MKVGLYKYICELLNIIPISIQLLITDHLLANLKWITKSVTNSFYQLFEDTKWVFRSHSLWEFSKEFNLFYYFYGPLSWVAVYHSKTVPDRTWIWFCSLENYGTSVAWTTNNSNTFWQSLRVRDTDVLLYIDIAFSSFRIDSDLLSLKIEYSK